LTLDRMADGGVHDRVGGGFHRYSTDVFWRVPHFEKMAYDQAALLENYLHAYQVTGKPAYAEVANGIVDYVLSTLSSPAGGFFAFQDADVSLHDDGSYFTWTKAELERVLSPEEFRAVEERFGIVEDPRQFRELPDRQVLAVRKDVDELAKTTGLTPARVEKLLQSALAKLRSERAGRRPPFVDQTIFASDNAMLISAFLDAWRILGREDAKKRALDSYDFVLAHLGRPDGTFFHAYGQGQARVEAWLADQVWMAKAALHVTQVRGAPRDLARARTLLDSLWKTHRDASKGGFFDLPPGLHSDNVYLSAPAKPIEDTPEPSANAVAIQALEEVASITGEGIWSRRAAETLDAFSGEGSDLGPSGGAYALAGFVAVNPGAHVVVVGDRSDPRSTALLRAAFRAYRPGSTALIFPRGSTREAPLAVTAQIEAAGQTSSPLAFVCVGTQCALPTAEPARVAELVRDFGRAPAAPKASASKKTVP
ncbi:MAG: thioredoxin domain-containing protein, partial [Thermoanaerobaculia bacterium]